MPFILAYDTADSTERVRIWGRVKTMMDEGELACHPANYILLLEDEARARELAKFLLEHRAKVFLARGEVIQL